MNLLKDISSENMNGLTWLNPPQQWRASGEGIQVYPCDHADFFIDPASRQANASAPYLYLDVDGDFVAQALVKPTFNTVWDSAVLMVRAGDDCWAKLCFEWCDAGRGYTGIVSVVTKGTSDDANGHPFTLEEVWLQICRVGNTFVLYWSPDGGQWSMVRLFGLDCGKSISVGVAAQCPAGPSVWHEIKSFSVENRTIGNLRKGV